MIFFSRNGGDGYLNAFNIFRKVEGAESCLFTTPKK